MMIKVGSEYLDFNGSVEVERKVKLFEEIDSADGDVSFGFDIPWTAHNVKTLNFPLPDNLSKSVYQRIDCDLQDDNGLSVYTGFLRIERVIRERTLFISFFSGNSNWFGLISGSLKDMDFSSYDLDQTEASIVSSWSNTSGITFPVIDNGGLLTRSIPQIKVEDFVGAFYVKTIFKKIFQDATIKIQGELFNEPLYNALVTIKNSKSQEEIDANSSYVFTSGSSRPADDIPYKVTWTDDFTYPYYDGSADAFDLPNSRYVAPVKMIAKVEVNMESENLVGINEGNVVMIYVNGVEFVRKNSTFPGQGTILSITKKVPLEAGDILEIYSMYTTGAVTDLDIISGTVKITPSYIYKTFGDAAVPNWTKQEYVSNIFQLFNVITSYESKTKTLTCNLFNKIKDKTPIDLSEYVIIDEVDYESFISNYGKKTKFSYNEVDFDEVKDYNIANFFKYGQGIINVDNDFLDEQASVIESEFSNPFSYINGVFDMSMERTNLIELEEDEELDTTGITDSSGQARFAIADDIFIVGDLVRISNSTNVSYNGDWVINVQATGYVEFQGLIFDGNANATLTKLSYTYNNSDDVYLLVNIPLYSVTNFSSNSSILLESTEKTELGIAYFSLLNTNRQINTDYKQSLSFGEIEDPLFYQRTLLQTYWSLFERILNDPVKPICTAHIPLKVYRSIDFLRPVMIKTLETSNLYYLNLISGYKTSYQPARIELIKLP